MAKTNISFFNLYGSAKDIRSTAECIASMKPSSTNAYVMGLDDEGEILWCVDAGREEGLEDMDMTSKELCAVEYYDHNFVSGKCTEKWEQVFVRSGKRGDNYIKKYFEKVAECECEIGFIENYTAHKVETRD